MNSTLAVIVWIAAILYWWCAALIGIDEKTPPFCHEAGFLTYLILVVFSVFLLPVNILVGKVGAWFSSFASPRFFFASSMGDIFFKKLGFMFGPTIVMCVVTDLILGSFLQENICK